MSTRIPTLVAALFLTAACSSEPAGPLALADMPNIDTAAALADITKLASDEFEGRGPGSKGEQLTVQYISDQFKAAGLAPGNPDGTWTQKVPLVGLTPTATGPLVVKGTKGGQTKSFKVRDEFVPFSRRVTDEVTIKDSELVFVGYGVQAPEFGWDDFKGLDVKGKTIVVLVNDPQVARASDPKTLDDAMFGGSRMTYYGRWTYKYEKAAELGADACIIVHETAYAGYGFNVVQGFGGERFDLVTPDKNMNLAKVQSWMSIEATKALFAMAGQNFDALKAKAQKKDFTPVPLGLTASFGLKQSQRTVDSQNVIGKLEGSDPVLKNEYVLYSAHWDHFGVGEADKTGDKIYNGASDNASGTAGLIAIARAMKALKPAPKRSILFLAVTAEEQGLLGSQYYAQFPLYPLEETLANINVDANLPLWGRTKDIIVIGLGASDLDDYLRAAANEQGRELVPDAEPEKGFYYRSDHFNFAKAGVPALDIDDGIDYIGKPADFGRNSKKTYTDTLYHQPSDEVDPAWPMSGYAEQAKLLMAVGYRVANAVGYPEWRPGNEFRAIRDKALGAPKR
jgi:Zn-dependent M28 family amino/carboxypeptidase